MGVFSNNSITDKGRLLLADVQVGAVFVPTRIVIGAGSLPGTVTTQTITDVIAPIKSLEINKKKRSNDGKCTFGGVYTNEDITEDFYFRELALYAKAVYLNEDGTTKSEGEEVLYSYGNSGNTADLMPAYSASTVVERQIDLVVWVGNNVQIALTVESGIYVTHDDFDSHAARHAAGGEDQITPIDIGAAATLPRATPTTTGHSELATYLLALKGMGYKFVTFNTSQFIDLPQTDWDFSCLAFFDGTVSVTITRFLSNSAEIRVREIGVDNAWMSDWVSVYNTSNKPTLAEIGAAPAGIVSKTIKIASETELDNALTEEINTMAYDSARFLVFAPTISSVFGGVAVLCRLYKRSDSGYGTADFIGYATYGPNVWHKSWYGGVWQPIEWVNPPMALGVEYRTTERWNGKPVYTALIDCGAMPSNGATTTINIPPPIYGTIGQVLRCNGAASDGNTIPFSWSGEYMTEVSASRAAIFMYSRVDNTGNTATVQIWYTKW